MHGIATKTGGALALAAALLLLVALTTVVKAEHVVVWKFSILATEYGHWLALACFLLMGAWGMKPSAGIAMKIVLAALFLCALLFSRSTVQAWTHIPQWSADFQKTFGVAMTEPVLSFPRLWFGRREVPVVPERRVYATTPSGDLFLDVYRAASGRPTPWVLMVHGGGWDSGDMSQLPELNSHLARRGITAVTISYRLAPRWKWPAQKEDTLAAVAYLKNHAKELNLDPSQWVILGRSAGGQIAEAVGYQEHDVSLKGVIAYYTPADLDFAYRYTKDKDIINSRDLLINFVGADPAHAPDLYRDGSPIEFVNTDSPPTLLFHGTRDPLTWVLQSRRLFDKIQAAHGRGFYIELPWATHGFDFNFNGPAAQVATAAVDGFLTAVFNK